MDNRSFLLLWKASAAIAVGAERGTYSAPSAGTAKSRIIDIEENFGCKVSANFTSFSHL